jgi:hypothetical protein
MGSEQLPAVKGASIFVTIDIKLERRGQCNVGAEKTVGCVDLEQSSRLLDG